jgi:hypothetical protein
MAKSSAAHVQLYPLPLSLILLGGTWGKQRQLSANPCLDASSIQTPSEAYQLLPTVLLLALMMEAACYFRILEATYKTTRCHRQRNHNMKQNSDIRFKISRYFERSQNFSSVLSTPELGYHPAGDVREQYFYSYCNWITNVMPAAILDPVP